MRTKAHLPSECAGSGTVWRTRDWIPEQSGVECGLLVTWSESLLPLRPWLLSPWWDEGLLDSPRACLSAKAPDSPRGPWTGTFSPLPWPSSTTSILGELPAPNPPRLHTILFVLGRAGITVLGAPLPPTLEG